MPKYYAVRNGRKRGIYNSWDECKTQTNGYTNAKFKSFKTSKEAEEYMNGNDVSSRQRSDNWRPLNDNSLNTQMSGTDDRLRIYTDGACAGNGKANARGGIGVHFPDKPEYDISEPLFGRQTNNRAEILAAVRALEVAKEMGHKKVQINTDSNFLYQSITEWLNKWERNDWKTSDGRDVINKEELVELVSKTEGMDVQWRKVAAHKGLAGNEEADRLANEGIQRGQWAIERGQKVQCNHYN